MERITFVAFHNESYLLHVKPETKHFRGEILEVIPAKLIEFIGGKYTTDDPEEIELIRATRAFRQGKVREAAEGAEAGGMPTEQVEEVAEQKTVRGAISSRTISEEVGAQVGPEKRGALKLEERAKACDFPGCGKIFADDPHGKRVRMHKLSHRKVEERKKAIELAKTQSKEE